MTTFRSVAPVCPVTDVERTAEWYVNELGFEARWINRDPDGDDPTSYAVLSREGVTIHLVLAEAPIADYMPFQVHVDDVDSLFSELESKGIPVSQEPTDQHWGHRDCAFVDPDGNPIWFSQAIAS